jgi:hypothetical protein
MRGHWFAPVSLTNKRHYLELVRSHAVCIATTGLHGSTGWKFSEYVAAARGIVTEPLRYEVPGDFKSEQNYLEFTNEDELIAGISDLVRNRRACAETYDAVQRPATITIIFGRKILYSIRCYGFWKKIDPGKAVRWTGRKGER